MHHKILAGINSSPSARHAFVCTLRYAAEVQAEVVGLLVESPFWKAPRYGKQEFESAVRINAERLARQYGVPFEFKVRQGYPARTISEQARLLACDLVVPGARPRFTTASLAHRQCLGSGTPRVCLPGAGDSYRPGDQHRW
ncbi:MAG TPA: universal stress protein [Chloroflexota bacterium]|nr:universal stress protein [Chloroflexota bacterium]